MQGSELYLTRGAVGAVKPSPALSQMGSAEPCLLPAPCHQRRMAPARSLLLAECFNGNPAKIIFL